MLISFKVKNFRSFHQEQTFSMQAYERHGLGLNTHAWATQRADIPYVLKNAVIFGANASGKSNFLKAIQFMKGFVLQSVTVANPGVEANLVPFLLNEDSRKEPTLFEIELLIEGVRYQYGFSLLQKKVLEEYLIAYPKKNPQTWFCRQWNDEAQKYEYKYSTHFKGNKKTWEETTRESVLYLSTAVALNSVQLRPIYDWFGSQLVVINDVETLNQRFTIEQIKSGKHKDNVVELLKSADLSISSIELQKRKTPAKNVVFDTRSETVKINEEVIEEDIVLFGHQTDEGTVYLPINFESAGTQKFFQLAGPLIDILSKKVTILIDELDTSLHPMLVEKIVELFETVSDKTEGAQLIFTTHCESLLENNTSDTGISPLLRRDQVWFVSKDHTHASTLYSLLEFKVRNNESVREGYRRGRFDGIPMIENLRFSVKE